MPRPAALMFVAVLTASAAPGDARGAHCRDRKPTTWDIEVGPASEPGERLVVTGHVLSRVGRAPLSGITVYVYHADAKGLYIAPGHENELPRLCGVLRTNEAGEFRIRTSMPGGYGGALPHIHFEVWGPRVQRQMLFVNLERKQAVRDTSRVLVLPIPHHLLRRARADITRPVERGADGVLGCVRDLVVDAR